MAWLFLLAAGLVEVAFALSIEPTKGFTRPLQTALCLVLGAASIYLLTHALKTLPIGTAYAFSRASALPARLSWGWSWRVTPRLQAGSSRSR